MTLGLAVAGIALFAEVTSHVGVLWAVLGAGLGVQLWGLEIERHFVRAVQKEEADLHAEWPGYFPFLFRNMSVREYTPECSMTAGSVAGLGLVGVIAGVPGALCVVNIALTPLVGGWLLFSIAPGISAFAYMIGFVSFDEIGAVVAIFWAGLNVWNVAFLIGNTSGFLMMKKMTTGALMTSVVLIAAGVSVASVELLLPYDAQDTTPWKQNVGAAISFTLVAAVAKAKWPDTTRLAETISMAGVKVAAPMAVACGTLVVITILSVPLTIGLTLFAWFLTNMACHSGVNGYITLIIIAQISAPLFAFVGVAEETISGIVITAIAIFMSGIAIRAIGLAIEKSYGTMSAHWFFFAIGSFCNAIHEVTDLIILVYFTQERTMELELLARLTAIRAVLEASTIITTAMQTSSRRGPPSLSSLAAGQCH